MARVGTGTIMALIMGLIFLTILMSVANSVIPTAATSFHNLTDSLKGNTDVFGTDAATFAGNMDGYLGWFWVIGPFALAVLLVLSVFKAKRR